MIKIGVLGCGNMGGAILKGWAANSALRGEFALLAYDLNPGQCAGENITAVDSAERLAQEADYLLLALKPQVLPQVLRQFAPFLTEGKLLVSIAAGLDMAAIRAHSGGRSPIVRVMPNTPAMVNKGIFGLCFDDATVSQQQISHVKSLFAALGETYILPESKFNAFMAISGCGPAYIFYLLDALVEAGVTLGFSRAESRNIVFSLCDGSVALAGHEGKALAVLREEVCSPAGSTIAAMNHLDRTAVRGHIIDAVLAAFEKGKNLA